MKQIIFMCLHSGVGFHIQVKYADESGPRGGHTIVKLKTTWEQSLLPLYYMP